MWGARATLATRKKLKGLLKGKKLKGPTFPRDRAL